MRNSHVTVIQTLHSSSQLAQDPVSRDRIHPHVSNTWSLELFEDLGSFRGVLAQELSLRSGSIGPFSRLS